jgi:hypothetical protein
MLSGALIAPPPIVMICGADANCGDSDLMYWTTSLMSPSERMRSQATRKPSRPPHGPDQVVAGRHAAVSVERILPLLCRKSRGRVITLPGSRVAAAHTGTSTQRAH